MRNIPYRVFFRAKFPNYYSRKAERRCTMKKMKKLYFEEVYKLLEEGKFLRKKSWPFGHFIFCQGNPCLCIYTDGCTFSKNYLFGNTKDKEAQDWEEFFIERRKKSI